MSVFGRLDAIMSLDSDFVRGSQSITVKIADEKNIYIILNH